MHSSDVFDSWDCSCRASIGLDRGYKWEFKRVNQKPAAEPLLDVDLKRFTMGERSCVR